MSADLYLYAFPAGSDLARRADAFRDVGSMDDFDDITETPELDEFGRLEWAGAYWVTSVTYENFWNELMGAPNIWIGQNSVLKAALLNDAERYIPAGVRRVWELTDNAPVLTPGLAKAITIAIASSPNRSIYGKRQYYRDADGKLTYTRRAHSEYRSMRINGLVPARVLKRWLAEQQGKVLVPFNM